MVQKWGGVCFNKTKSPKTCQDRYSSPACYVQELLLGNSDILKEIDYWRVGNFII